MNTPPTRYTLVNHEQLEAFVLAIARAAGLADPHASLLSRLLIENELRGVITHGARQIANYARLLKSGAINPDPKVTTVREGSIHLTVDGDGGLGYFPAHEGTTRVIDKAREHGVGLLMTRNHGHFGAAGAYTRMTLEHDLLCFVTSGHQLKLDSRPTAWDAAGYSPMSFSTPAGEEPAIVVDIGTMHDFYAHDRYRDAIAKLAPGVVVRALGLGAICMTWGAMLTGIPCDDAWRPTWPAADQGALLIAFRIDLFADPAEFKARVDQYVRKTRDLEPIHGFERACLAGTPEAEREAAYRSDGIPLADESRRTLEKIAEELGVAPPWPS